MADDSEKLLAKLDSLNDSLDALEGKLDSLLAQTLPESLLPLETIQQVKLNVAIPYLVYDLVFIYLKTRGIDPKTHPVVAELDRVRQYFDKIKNAEDPEKRKNTVDKAAANRFIKHAIAQVRAQRPSGEAEGSSATHIRFDAEGNAPTPVSASASSIPVKVTSKMRARAEYEKELAAQGSDEEEEELEVYGEGDAEEDGEPETKSSKDKGKGRATEETDKAEAASSAKKRRRAAVDPFAGYGDENYTKAAKKKSKKKSSVDVDGEDALMGEDTNGSNTPESTPSSKKATVKKARRKAKKTS